MGRVKFDFFGVPTLIIALYFLFNYLFFDLFYGNQPLLLLFSVVLFLLGAFFMKLAGRTDTIAKEAYFSTLSSIFIYFSLFEIPLFLKFFDLRIGGFVFIILFLLFILFQGGSFKNIIIDFLILLFVFAKMLFIMPRAGFAYYSLITAIALFAAFFIGYKFSGRNLSFEKELFMQDIFSVSFLIFFWGVVRLIK